MMAEAKEAQSKPTEHILIVDDEDAIRKICARILQGLGFSTSWAGDGEEALARLKEKPADVVLTDLSMPVMDGMRLSEEVRRRHPGTDIIIMTAYPRLETAIPLLRDGAYDYLIKPFDKDYLSSVMNRCLQKRRLSTELSREKILRSELEAAYQELQKLEKMKEAFLSRVNHELRTPLAPTILALESLEKEVSGSSAHKMFQTVQANIARLQEVVENLLVFAELRRENFTTYATSVDLPVMLQTLVDRYKFLLDEKRLKLSMAVDEDVREIWGAPKLLETALRHLLLNAIQFNRREGEIRIRAKRSGGRAHIVVEDTGIGIPKEQQDHVFDSFYQVAEYLTREVGGLGLGLAIVRRVVEAHGGSVRLDSDGRTGSVFHVELPFREPTVDKILQTIEKSSDRNRDS
jgi:signal transduction histidine kinase